VSQPGDALEREADDVAMAFTREATSMQTEHSGLRRQPEALPEEERKKKEM